MYVRDCMTPKPVTITTSCTLSEAYELMLRKHIRHLPVVDAQLHLVGLVTDRDIRRVAPSPLLPAVRAEAEQIMETTTVERVMVHAPATVTPEQPLADAVRIMVDKKFGALPVLQGGKLVGILSQIDVLRQWLKAQPRA